MISQPVLRWRAAPPDLYFECPRCLRWFLNGNPLLCPHNAQPMSASPNAKYDPQIDGPVEGIIQVLRACGYFHLAKDIEGGFRDRQ